MKTQHRIEWSVNGNDPNVTEKNNTQEYGVEPKDDEDLNKRINDVRLYKKQIPHKWM